MKKSWFLLPVLIVSVGLLLPAETAAQYDLTSDSTDTSLIAVFNGDSMQYARYKKRVVAAENVGKMLDGCYFTLEELQSKADPESDPEPALLLAKLLRRGVRVEEAWYSPRGRAPTSGNLTAPGFPSALILIRLNNHTAEELDMMTHPVDDPNAWLQENRSEYAHYSFMSGGSETE